MITHLVRKENKLICHNCRMEQKELRETCWFCGYFFSNYEVIAVEGFKKQNEISDDNN